MELINSPAFYDCVMHIICNSGSGSFRYNGNLFSIEKDDIAVISHPRLVSEIIVSENFKCEYIAAPDKFLHNLLPANNYSIQGSVSLFDNPIIKVSSEDARRFRRDIENIVYRLDNTNHHFYPEMIGSLLQTMVYDLFDFHVKVNESTLTTDRVGYITSRFMAMMEAGMPKTQREVAHYASCLNVTPKYLSDTIKRVTGNCVSAYINRTAASIIKSYLDDDKLSITQIADEMNFKSLSHFSRYTTKVLGISPSRYRTAGSSRIFRCSNRLQRAKEIRGGCPSVNQEISTGDKCSLRTHK